MSESACLLEARGWSERDTFESGYFRGMSQAREARTGVVYVKRATIDLLCWPHLQVPKNGDR